MTSVGVQTLLGIGCVAALLGILLLVRFAVGLEGLPELEASWSAFARSRGYLYRSPSKGIFGWSGARGPGSDCPPKIEGICNGVPFEVKAYRDGRCYQTKLKTCPPGRPEATWIYLSRTQDGEGCVLRHGIYWRVSPNVQFLASDPRFDQVLQQLGRAPSFRSSTLYSNVHLRQPTECVTVADEWCLVSGELDVLVQAATGLVQLWSA